MPFCGALVLPIYLKLLTLFLIFMFGFLSYFLVQGNVFLSFFRFIGSMWFLRFITAAPFIKVGFSLGDLVYRQELT